MRGFLVLFVLLLSGMGLMGEAPKIREGQKLLISTTGVPESGKEQINREYVVSKEGKIAMWGIGEVLAEGKTKSDLAQSIAKRYREEGIYDGAVFQVIGRLVTLAPEWERNAVVVGGDVKKPGPVRWKKGMTLKTVLELAGGVTERGDEGWLWLYRNGKKTLYGWRNEEHQKVEILKKDLIDVSSKAGLKKE